MQLNAALGRAFESEVKTLEHLDDRPELRGTDGLADRDDERRYAVAEVTKTERIHRREHADPALGLEQPWERMDRRNHDLDLMKSPLVSDSQLREDHGRDRCRLRFCDERLSLQVGFAFNDLGLDWDELRWR